MSTLGLRPPFPNQPPSLNPSGPAFGSHDSSEIAPVNCLGFHLPFFFLFLFFAISWAAPEAYGSCQDRGLIGAAAAGLHHRHSNARSEPRLQPTPQLTAMPDP